MKQVLAPYEGSVSGPGDRREQTTHHEAVAGEAQLRRFVWRGHLCGLQLGNGRSAGTDRYHNDVCGWVRAKDRRDCTLSDGVNNPRTPT